MRVAFLPVAAVELGDAVAFYNRQSEGLGFQFALAVQRTLDRIAAFPDAWPVLSERTRRCRMRRFPYGLIYRVQEDTLLIVAVMHLQRHPDAWRDRVPSDGP